jgi:hypothetical protein
VQKYVYALFSRPCLKRRKIPGSDEKLQESVISSNNKRWSAVETDVEPEILEDMGVGMLEDEGPGDGQKTQKSSLEQVTQYSNNHRSSTI